MRVMNGLSINQPGKESKSLEIGSQGGRVSTHYAMDKETLSKIPKENWNDKNTFSFLIKSFY